MAEFDSVNGGLNRADIRQRFLVLLEKLAPEVVKELAGKPFEMPRNIKSDNSI